MNPSVEKNQQLNLEIKALNAEGQGIARLEGYVVFVPFALPGEQVLVQIIKVTAKFAVAKLLNIQKPSPDRVEPSCEHFRRCGGCTLQHMSYEAQLRYKRQSVEDAIRKIGGFKDVEVQPVIGMEHPWGYRNKGAFPFAQTEQGVELGMYAQHSHKLIPLSDCALQQGDIMKAQRIVRDWAKEMGIPAYDEERHAGILRHMVTRCSDSGDGLLVVLVCQKPLPCSVDTLVERLKQEVMGFCGLVENINRQDTNTILGRENHLLSGVQEVYERIGDLYFKVSPHSFFQVNSTQVEHLYDQVRKSAALQKNEVLLDAYCGVGSIGQYLARDCARVIGIEIVKEAVEDARENAKRNHIENTEYVLGRAEDLMGQLAKTTPFDVIVLDPPRKGCDLSFIQAAAQTGVFRMVYVSCNPATLARDLKAFAELGYEPRRIQPVDMFPQTGHVECVVGMQRKDT